MSFPRLNPEGQQYIVPFHGFDPRQNSLVFTALPATLADLITVELESLQQKKEEAVLEGFHPHRALRAAQP